MHDKLWTLNAFLTSICVQTLLPYMHIKARENTHTQKYTNISMLKRSVKGYSDVEYAEIYIALKRAFLQKRYDFQILSL